MITREFSLFVTVVMLLVVAQACSPVSPKIEPTTDESSSLEYSAPEGAIMARDASLAHAQQTMGVPGLTSLSEWSVSDVTSKDIVGQTTVEFTSGNWMVTISFPVVAPENVIYTVEVRNPISNFEWIGTVDPAGNVRDIDGGSSPDAFIVAEHADARNAALAFVYNHYVPDASSQIPPTELEWDVMEVSAKVGRHALEYSSLDWIVRVKAETSAPNPQSYEIEITNQTLGIDWVGTVDYSGRITEIQVPEPPVESMSPAEGEIQAIGWYGHIESIPAGGQWDDKLVLSNYAGEVGIDGATDELRSQIVALRDQPEPGKYAHFWGTLFCGVPDFGGCQFVVLRIRSGATFTESDHIVAWQGTQVSNPPGSQFDDYFVLSGDFPVAFGIHSINPALQAQLENLRDKAQEFRVWGLLRTGVPDAYGSQIQVDQIEVLP